MPSLTLATNITSLCDNPDSKLYNNITFRNKLEYGNFTKTEWEIINSEYSRFSCSLDEFDSLMTPESIASQIHYLLNCKAPSEKEIQGIRKKVSHDVKELGKTKNDDLRQRLFLKHLKLWKPEKRASKKFNKVEFIGKTITLLSRAETMEDGQPFYYFSNALAEYVYPQIIERVWKGQYKPRKVHFLDDLKQIRELGSLLLDSKCSKKDVIDMIPELRMTIGRLSKNGNRQSVNKYVTIREKCPPIPNLH